MNMIAIGGIKMPVTNECLWKYNNGEKCEYPSCFECPKYQGNNKEFLEDLRMEQQEQMQKGG